MELKTNCEVLNQQLQQCSNIVSALQYIGVTASQLANQENTVEDVEVQIKALMASATIQMQALNSQDVLVQQTIDKILAMVNITEQALQNSAS